MKICVTGHRPKRLGLGYDYNHPIWISLKNEFKKILKEKNCTEAVTGMALGVDMVFALAVIELQQEGYKIALHCAIPCKNHPDMWRKESIDLYNYILSKAQIKVIVTNEEYKPWMMPKRNEYMVNNTDEVIAVWDGIKEGGTWHCIKYAQKHHKNITYIPIKGDVQNANNNR